jgi:hypothetical protein
MLEPTPFHLSPAGLRGATAKKWAPAGELSRDGNQRDWRTLIPVLSRLLVMGLALVLLKTALVISQGQNLYEAHWRLDGASGSWLNYLGFFLFVLIGGASLLQLQRAVSVSGAPGVRVVNGVVLALGLGFIFLSLRNGDKNLLYPAFSGILKWNSLGPYAANALFFNKPFLAAWMAAYAIAYAVLISMRRENRALLLTSLFGCAYALIYLREFMLRGPELLVIDSLGVLSIIATWRANRTAARRLGRIGMACLLAPLVWTSIFAAALLRFDTQWQSFAASYFIELLLLTVLLFFVATVAIRRVAKPASWAWLLPFFVVGFLLLTDTNYPSSENYNHLLCLGLTFPRYFAGELMMIGLIGLAGFTYRHFRPLGGLRWLDVICAGALLVVAVDFRLSQIMGVRLGWDLLSFGDSPRMMLKMAKPYLPGAITGVVILIGLYVFLVRIVEGVLKRRYLDSSMNTRSGGRGDGVPATGFFASAPALSYASGVVLLLCVVGLAWADGDKAEGEVFSRLVQTSPLWKRVSNRLASREEFVSTARSLGLGEWKSAGAVAPVKTARDLNVLVVFMESSYNKHLSLFGSAEETQPLLAKYKNRMEVFPNFFSAFAGSIHARFATFTSLYPVRDFHAFTQEHVPVKSLFEVLHDNGYSCSMFYSSYFDYTGFRDFLKNRSFDEMYDADTMPGQHGAERVEWGVPEAQTLGAIRQQLQNYAQNHRRFCLTYVPAAPHNPYDHIPKPFQKYKMKEMGDFTPLYLNELLYMDWVISSIIDQLKESGLLDNTMVVITNDHGEMVGSKEDGHLGHGWAITPQLANTPLIVMDPAQTGFRVNPTIGTQVDFLPTILDRLNIPIPADQLYEGLSLDAGAAREGRLGYLNSYKQFAIVDGNKLLLGDRECKTPVGAASRGAAFSIANEGARTVFTETAEAGSLPDRVSALSRFDSFQENLLRNYAFYCQEVHGNTIQLARAQKR